MPFVIECNLFLPPRVLGLLGLCLPLLLWVLCLLLAILLLPHIDFLNLEALVDAFKDICARITSQ